MLKVLVVAVVLVAATARAEPAVSPGPAKVEAVRKTRVAVLDVQYAGAGDRKTVEGLSALLASEVARRPSLTVLAGADLRAMIGFERQKQLLGCTESSCIAELAGALGVAYLVSSEVSKVGSTWLLSLTLLDANKAMAQGRLTRKAYSDDQLVDETAGAVDELLKALPAAGLPTPRTEQPSRAEPASASPATATGQVPAGFHRHDGAFLRFHLGFGGLKSDGGRIGLSGTAGSFAIASGFSITDDLVLYGEIFDDVATSPKFTRDGLTVPSGDKVTHTMIGYGAGLAWYFTPYNAYVGAMAGVGELSIEVTSLGAVSQVFKTQLGPVVRLGVGKEWWVSTDWGLGVALNFEMGRMKDSGANSVTFTSTAYSVAFSATYN